MAESLQKSLNRITDLHTKAMKRIPSAKGKELKEVKQIFADLDTFNKVLKPMRGQEGNIVLKALDKVENETASRLRQRLGLKKAPEQIKKDAIDLDTIKASITEKFNPHHVPAGSSEGGQFTSAGGAGGFVAWKELNIGEMKAKLRQDIITDEDQVNAISVYTIEEHTYINAYARDGEHGVEEEIEKDWRATGRDPDFIETDEELEQFNSDVNEHIEDAKFSIENLDKAIASVTIDQDIVTYRGISLTSWGIDPEDVNLATSKDVANVLRQEYDGMEFTSEGYTSTSLGQGVAIGFADRAESPGIMEIRVPKGSNALDIDRQGGSAGGEHEILLPRNTSFKIIEISTFEVIEGGRSVPLIVVEAVNE